MTSSSFLMAFLPELVLLLGAFVLFVITLGHSRVRLARIAALITALATVATCALCLREQAVLFSGAYRVDQFSQLLKLVFACGFTAILLLSDRLPDIRDEIQPEYYLFLTMSVSGLVIALELSSYPLYLMVPMRRERVGQRTQMESAIKYIMFGVASNGILLFAATPNMMYLMADSIWV